MVVSAHSVGAAAFRTGGKWRAAVVTPGVCFSGGLSSAHSATLLSLPLGRAGTRTRTGRIRSFNHHLNPLQLSPCSTTAYRFTARLRHAHRRRRPVPTMDRFLVRPGGGSSSAKSASPASSSASSTPFSPASPTSLRLLSWNMDSITPATGIYKNTNKLSALLKLMGGEEGGPDIINLQETKRTSLSGSISTIWTVLSWICAGIYMCAALPSPVCA